VNQKKRPPIDNLWIKVATLSVEAKGKVVVTISNADTDGHVIADAVQLVPAR